MYFLILKAEGDYPYSTNFFGPVLPPRPVNYSCGVIINETSKGVDILTAFKDMLGVFYNDSGPCFDLNTQVIVRGQMRNLK
jgi:hypothetical protein